MITIKDVKENMYNDDICLTFLQDYAYPNREAIQECKIAELEYLSKYFHELLSKNK